MARLTAKQRRDLPARCFALRKERKYPLTDARHVGLAVGYAHKLHKKGKVTTRQLHRIVKAAARGPCKV